MYKIMIVSEDEFLGQMVHSALFDLSAEVWRAGCAAEAAEFCGRVMFDVIVVLTDSPSSYCGGFKSSSVHVRHRPTVYVVAWQQSEQMVLGLLESGVDQYLTFPVNLQRLRAKVVGELKARAV